MDIKFEVKPAPLWDRNHKLLGYFPAIFGPTRTRSCTYIVPALIGPSATPRYYSTPDAAMAAWEKGQPAELSEGSINLYIAAEEAVAKINQLELYRRPKVTL